MCRYLFGGGGGEGGSYSTKKGGGDVFLFLFSISPGAIWIDCIWCGGGLRFWHWLSQPTKMNIIQSKI